MNSEPNARQMHVGPIGMEVGVKQILQPTILTVVVAKVVDSSYFPPLLCTLNAGGKTIQFKQALNL